MVNKTLSVSFHSKGLENWRGLCGENKLLQASDKIAVQSTLLSLL